MQALIVVLNYNGKKYLEYCLPSLIETPDNNYELLLVDNASTDDSVLFTKKFSPSVEILKNKFNLAWAEGNNVAIRYGLNKNFKYFALLNNDIIVSKFWLSEATKLFESEPDTGIIGFNIIGETKKETFEKFQKSVSDWKEISFSKVEYVSGCCMLVKKEVFEALGLIDKVYFKYGEEVDFECRAIKAGFRILKTNIPVWHAFAATNSKMPYSTAYYCIRNDLRFAIKQKGIKFLFIRFLKLAYNISLPFRTINSEDLLVTRLKPSNFCFNNLIFLLAIAWNIFFLPQTLFIRFQENKRIKNHIHENQ